MRDKQKTRFARRLRKAMTFQERLLWWKLRDQQEGWKFLRQKPLGPFVLDFACIEAQLAIEVDGATHGTPHDIAYDANRTRYLENLNWRVIRFHIREITDNLDGVVASIRLTAEEQHGWLSRAP